MFAKRFFNFHLISLFVVSIFLCSSFSVQAQSALGEGIIKVEIYDLQGRLLIKQNNNSSVNLSSLRAGLYQIRLLTENGYVVKTISKIK